MYVAYTIRSANPLTSWHRLPYADWRAPRGAFGLRVLRVDGTIVHESAPSDHFHHDRGDSFFRLGPGEERRIAVDLAQLLARPLAEQRYSATLIYGPLRSRVESHAFDLVVREPDAGEVDALQRHGAVAVREGSWAGWSVSPPQAGEELELPGRDDDPLAFQKVVRFLLHGDPPLAALQPDCLRTIKGVLEPEARALHAELLAAKDRSGFHRLATDVRTQFPGLSYWMDALEQGRSIFQFQRSVVRGVP